MGFLSSIGGFLGPVAGPVSSIVGGLISAKKAKKAAQKQMDFQQRMSDTAHQREVADLKAAGLNPILSAGGRGASTPTGTSAAVPDFGSIASSAAQTSINYKQMQANVRSTTATARDKEIDNIISEDALKTYNSDPSVKEAVIGGNLGRRAGVPGPIGAVIGGSTSALRRWFKSNQKVLKQGSDRTYQSERSKTIRNREIDDWIKQQK